MNLGNFGANSNASMFDFLKDGKHTENKYKSTSMIPMIPGEDLTIENAALTTVNEEVMMTESEKEQEYTPFFNFDDDDMEMDEPISSSDDMFSEQSPESLNSDPVDNNKGKL